MASGRQKGSAPRPYASRAADDAALEKAANKLLGKEMGSRGASGKNRKALDAAKEKAKSYALPYEIEPGRATPHFNSALKYAREVVAQKIRACEFVQQAAARFIRMLDDDRFIVRKDLAERVCNFIECMPHVKGKWKSKNITTEPWQKMVVCCIFAFYWAASPTMRVVRSVYIEIPRKNAKSTLAAGIGLYMLTEDDEEGAEVYSAATTHKQALAIFDTARLMAVRQPNFAHKHGLIVGAHSIHEAGSLTKFEALHSQGNTLDGLNIFCALIDELHAHPNRAVYDVLETAVGSRQNPLIFNITTAGSNRAGICYELRTYVTKILAQKVDDPTWFGIIYTLDAGDDPFDERNWFKANPNLDVSTSSHELRRLAAKAATQPAALNNFLTKHLDVWVNAGTAWLAAGSWDMCYDPDMKIEDFKGEECTVGLDLASKLDLAGKARWFTRNIAGKRHYYLFATHYLPAAVVSSDSEEGERISALSGWVREGWITTTPGSVLDHDIVEEDILSDAENYMVKEVAYDPFQATMLVNHLSDAGFTCVEVRPTVLNFSNATKEFQALVKEKRIHHNNDPVLSWMVSNVVIKFDQKDNVYPTKDGQEQKIDAVIAAIMGLNRLISTPTESKPPEIILL